MKKSAPYKLWGGRFQKEPAAALRALSHSLHFDYRLAVPDIIGTKAYARALQGAGILSRKEYKLAARALDELALEIASAPPEYFAGAGEEDIHTFVLGKLRERVGLLAEKLHTGRSRNEQVALDFRLWTKDTARALQRDLAGLLAALLAAADKAPAAILPGYTHLRRAQPVLWPHYLLAYFEMFRRDYERLEGCHRAADVLPLGSGALAGSGLQIDRRELARELKFSRLSRNSMDAVSDRDFALEFLFAASLCLLHLSRLAEDWILYSSEEFGFLELSDEVTTGSSLMPQKKNPDSLELIRGKAGRVLGQLVALAVTVKALPLTYNRDLQEDKEPVFEAARQLGMALKAAEEVVRTVQIRADLTRQAAWDGWLCATDLAEHLSRKGVPFHQAHEIVGRLVLESVRAGRQPRETTLEHLSRYSPHFGREALALLVPEAGVRRRAVEGGTAPGSVQRALREARNWLKKVSR